MQSLASILSFHQPDIADLDDFDDEDDEFDRELTPGKISELTSQYTLTQMDDDDDPFNLDEDAFGELDGKKTGVLVCIFCTCLSHSL